MDAEQATWLAGLVGGALFLEARLRPILAAMLEELRQHRREDAAAHGITQQELASHSEADKANHATTHAVAGRIAAKVAAVLVVALALVACVSSVTAESAAMFARDLETFGASSAPAPGVDPAAWEAARAALVRHSRELEERAR